MDTQDWTDEELCQVYDLQHGYEKVLIDFVRHEEQIEVSDLLGVLPELYAYDEESAKPYFFRSNEISPETAALWGLTPKTATLWDLREDYQDHDFIYRDTNGQYKTADDLREVFEGTFQYELGIARPEILALLGNNYQEAQKTYSRESFDHIRVLLPERFLRKMNRMMEEFPEDIRQKAMQTEVYGYTSMMNRMALTIHANEQETATEKFERVTERQNADDIVAAYDLQMQLTQAAPELSGDILTETVRTFRFDPERIRNRYGSKVFGVLKNAKEEALDMATKVDFVHTEERLPVLENHKTCLFGTEEEKIALYLREDSFAVSNQDAKAILDTLTDHYEKEGFAQRYVPLKGDPLHFADKTFKVVGRSLPDAKDYLPHWEIDLGDGKLIRASADEIIPSAIPELQRRLYLPDPTPRKLEEAVLQPEERKSVTRKEAEKKLSQLLQEFQKSGVKVNGIMELLNSAGRKLQAAQGR